MELTALVEQVKIMYQEKDIARCRYNALDKVIDFITIQRPEVVKNVSLLGNIDKKQLKNDYEQSKGIKINGAEKQAINDLYNNLQHN